MYLRSFIAPLSTSIRFVVCRSGYRTYLSEIIHNMYIVNTLELNDL